MLSIPSHRGSGAAATGAAVRTLRFAALFAVVCASCGSAQSPVGEANGADDGAGAASPVVPETSTSDDYTSAKFPLLVAMGLPDSEDEAMVILRGRYEHRLADCMASAGFRYEPALNSVADSKNTATVNGLPEVERRAWYEAYHGGSVAEQSGEPQGCAARAAAATFVFNALGELFEPYASMIMDDPAVRQALAAHEQCLQRVNEPASADVDAIATGADQTCPQDALEAAKQVARRAAEIAFVTENEAAVRAFAKESASA